MKIKGIALLCSILVLGSCMQKAKETFTMNYCVENIGDIKKLFPQTIEEVNAYRDQAIAQANQDLAKILAIAPQERTLENTIKAYDEAVTHLNQAQNVSQVLTMVCAEQEIVKAAQEALVILGKQMIELFTHNKELYQAFQEYYALNAHNENLSVADNYFIQEIIKDFQRRGLNLDEQTRQKIMAFEKELTELETTFDQNICHSNPTIIVRREELAGIDDAFINNLKKTDDGNYILGVDSPTLNKILSFCSVSSTREQLLNAANNRAYPENEEVLKKIVQKRHELARLLGFPSFAHLSLSAEMVKDPEHARKFLYDLLDKAKEKAAIEFKKLTEKVPDTVQLSCEGKLYPWDRSYVIESYKKEHFNIDENLISHYFPMEKTIQELLAIYQEFFGLQFKQEQIEGLWDKEVKLVSVYDQEHLLGYLLLDLYPRPNKYNHACHATILPAMVVNAKVQPAVSLVIANFPPSTPTQPSLLKRSDVVTFFHEFGHALHALLGATGYGLTSGTSVKTDFVEMPSQMLEQWLWDPLILKRVSGHYQTGEPLPADILESLLTVKNISSANNLLLQIFYSLLSLNYFSGDCLDLYDEYKKIYEGIRIHEQFPCDSHLYTSFGHLTGYGAKYYGYLWSKVFALDLFDYIKKQGLLNPLVGNVYKNKVLAPAGSKDPYELLESFLGREPNQKAFLKDIGL